MCTQSPTHGQAHMWIQVATLAASSQLNPSQTKKVPAAGNGRQTPQNSDSVAAGRRVHSSLWTFHPIHSNFARLNSICVNEAESLRSCANHLKSGSRLVWICPKTM